jgi:hypothetical protein
MAQENLRVTCSSKCSALLRSHKFSKEEKESIISDYRNGMPVERIWEKYNISRMTTLRHLKKWGIPRRSKYRKHKVNEHFFDSISTPEQAYVFGLIYADGNISPNGRSMAVSLAGDGDKHILDECVKLVGGSIRSIDPNKYNKDRGHKKPLKPQNILGINSKHLCERLEYQGCHQNKSLDCQFPPHIEPSLMHHFIRGYFDGDGGIRLRFGRRGQVVGCTVDIVGSNPFCDGLYSYLVREKMRPYLYRVGKISRIAFTKFSKCEKFCDWIYQDCGTLRLNRKYERYLLLKSR